MAEGRSLSDNPSLYHVYGRAPDGTTYDERRSDTGNTPILIVEQLDLKIGSNSLAHHTDEYDITRGKGNEVIVRRGQSFDLTILLDRQFDKKTDNIQIVLFCGSSPNHGNKNLVEITLDTKTESSHDWEATTVSNEGTRVDVQVISPADCYVAIWQIDVVTLYNTDAGAVMCRYVHDKRIFMLFNPWCKEDTVYMPNEEDLNEYILNDIGVIASGNSVQIGTKKWNFGQFEEHVILCSMWLLDNKTSLDVTERGDVVKVARQISAFVNAQDDNGILVGNWSGNYEGATRPTNWVGSVNILAKYWSNKQPVKYAQCWVYSGVVTAICRALGIPCRSVTNFDSAHDTDKSATIDYVIDENGDKVRGQNNDSIWNFHVWNDVYMSRPDLEEGHGGWQAIDATPQEKSNHVYCAGPSPVSAIKKGMINVGYDTPFIFAEVNADRVKWLQKEDKSYVKLSRYRNSVGEKLITKDAHGTGDDVEDITLEYKYKEGSDEERAAVISAERLALEMNPSLDKKTEYAVYDSAAEDISAKFIKRDNILIGSPFDITVELTNEGGQRRAMSGNVEAWVTRYTGVDVEQLLRKDYDNIVIEPGETKKLDIHVEFDTYFPKLVEQANIRETVFFKVHETKQIINEHENFRLRRPDITLQIHDTAYVNEEVECRATLTNPLPIKLTRCAFNLEGPSTQKPLHVEIKDVAAGQDAEHVFKLTPRKAGNRTILATFECDEFADIAGNLTFNVQAARDLSTGTDESHPSPSGGGEDHSHNRPPPRRSNLCTII